MITVPDGLFPGLIDTLTGLTDLFVAVQRKVKYFSAMHHPVDLQELEHQQEVQRNYSRDVIAAFEAYLGRGATENEAIRNTRADLSERYPFSMYEAVKDVLRKAGKFQKVRKRRRK